MSMENGGPDPANSPVDALGDHRRSRRGRAGGRVLGGHRPVGYASACAGVRGDARTHPRAPAYLHPNAASHQHAGGNCHERSCCAGDAARQYWRSAGCRRHQYASPTASATTVRTACDRDGHLCPTANLDADLDPRAG